MRWRVRSCWVSVAATCEDLRMKTAGSPRRLCVSVASESAVKTSVLRKSGPQSAQIYVRQEVAIRGIEDGHRGQLAQRGRRGTAGVGPVVGNGGQQALPAGSSAC